jgi:hypothetical protein
MLGLGELLAVNPNLSNKGITIPFVLMCTAKVQPIHRLCDAVMSGKITDDEVVQFSKIFLGNGANIDGDINKGEGTPLIADASLHAEKLGIFYIEKGADVNYTDKKKRCIGLTLGSFLWAR